MFASAEDKKWEYSIRFNQSFDIPESSADTSKQMRPLARKNNAKTQKYNKGFLSIQQSVQAFARKAAPGASIPTVDLGLNFPTSEYTNTTFWANVSQFYPILMGFALMFTVIYITKTMVLEKEERIREAMFIMSLSRTSYYLSWLFTFMASMLVSALITAVVAQLVLFTNSNLLVLWIKYYLFWLSAFSFAFCVAGIFSKASVAVIVVGILWIGSNAVSSIPDPSIGAMSALSLFPMVALGNSIGVFAELEGAEIGVDFTYLSYTTENGWFREWERGREGGNVREG